MLSYNMEHPNISPNCLNMPLPPCLRTLAKAPPVTVPNANDSQVLDMIKELGRKSDVREIEIQQARNLASGFSDLVVILKRPAPHHQYGLDFEQFVHSCPTLNAVDELIRFATQGARSINTVTVLDAYSFKTKPDQEKPSDEDCHLLLERILKAKRPKVVLCCWNDSDNARCNNEFVAQFMSNGVGSQSIRDKVLIEGQVSILIRSFHPATAVCYNKCNADYRVLLVYHFVAAFRELRERIHAPQWLEAINIRCEKSMRFTQNDSFKPQEARNRAVAILQKIHGEIPKGSIRLGRPNAVVAKDPREVNDLLKRLHGSTYQNGAIDILRLCLLWNEYFQTHPVYQEVSTQLCKIASSQKWLQTMEQSSTGLEEPIRSLHVHDSSTNGKSGFVGIVDDDTASSDHEQEVTLLANLRKCISDYKNRISGHKRSAIDLASRVLFNIKLEMRASDSENKELCQDIVQLSERFYHHSREFAAQMQAAPILHNGGRGLIEDEEQSNWSILHHGSGKNLLDEVICDISSLVDRGFDCSLLVSGLLAQGKLLVSGITDGAEMEHLPSEILQKTPIEVHQPTADLKSTIDCLVALREELGGPRGIIEAGRG